MPEASGLSNRPPDQVSKRTRPPPQTLARVPEHIDEVQTALGRIMLLEKTTVSHRALVEIGTDQYYAAVLQPFVHLLARKTPLSLLTAEQPASAVTVE